MSLIIKIKNTIKIITLIFIIIVLFNKRINFVQFSIDEAETLKNAYYKTLYYHIKYFLTTAGQPPFFHILSGIWMRNISNSIGSLNILRLLLFLSSIYYFYKLAKYLKINYFLALLVFVFDSHILYYSTILVRYSLLIIFSIALNYYYLKKDFKKYIIALFFGILSHMYIVLVFLGHIIFDIFYEKNNFFTKSKIIISVKILSIPLLIIITLIFGKLNFIYKFYKHFDNIWNKANLSNLFFTLKNIIDIFHSSNIYTLLIILFYIVYIVTYYSKFNYKYKKISYFLAFMLISSILPAFIFGKITNTWFVSRDLISINLPLFIIFLFSNKKNTFMYILAIIIITGNYFNFYNYNNDSFSKRILEDEKLNSIAKKIIQKIKSDNFTEIFIGNLPWNYIQKKNLSIYLNFYKIIYDKKFFVNFQDIPFEFYLTYYVIPKKNSNTTKDIININKELIMYKNKYNRKNILKSYLNIVKILKSNYTNYYSVKNLNILSLFNKNKNINYIKKWELNLEKNKPSKILNIFGFKLTGWYDNKNIILNIKFKLNKEHILFEKIFLWNLEYNFYNFYSKKIENGIFLNDHRFFSLNFYWEIDKYSFDLWKIFPAESYAYDMYLKLTYNILQISEENEKIEYLYFIYPKNNRNIFLKYYEDNNFLKKDVKYNMVKFKKLILNASKIQKSDIKINAKLNEKIFNYNGNFLHDTGIGTWEITIVRKLKTNDVQDIQFEKNKSYKLFFPAYFIPDNPKIKKEYSKYKRNFLPYIEVKLK